MEDADKVLACVVGVMGIPCGVNVALDRIFVVVGDVTSTTDFVAGTVEVGVLFILTVDVCVDTDVSGCEDEGVGGSRVLVRVGRTKRVEVGVVVGVEAQSTTLF